MSLSNFDISSYLACSDKFIINREEREIMYLVASIRLSVCPSVRPSACLSAEKSNKGH